MKWTEGKAIQKVCKMRLVNIPFMNAFHFLTQQPITEATLHVVSGQTILSVGSLLSNLTGGVLDKEAFSR